MKLNQKQLLHIEKHLNYRELTQLDLRNEVLDHMALNIEKDMEDNNIGFIDAYNQEIQNWNSELKEYSSLWLGWMWVGPKIMMQKCIKETKRMYFISAGLAVILMLVCVLYTKLFGLEFPTPSIVTALGIIYLIYFGFALIGHFKISASNFETTYKHLFKINAIGYGLFYVIINPIWTGALNNSFFLSEDSFLVIPFHAVLLVFGYQFWALYKKHFNAKKMLLS